MIQRSNYAYYPELGVFAISGLQPFIEATPELIDRFIQDQCTCRIIFIEATRSIIVGGEDDCPVHGFGDLKTIEDLELEEQEWRYF